MSEADALIKVQALLEGASVIPRPILAQLIIDAVSRSILKNGGRTSGTTQASLGAPVAAPDVAVTTDTGLQTVTSNLMPATVSGPSGDGKNTSNLMICSGSDSDSFSLSPSGPIKPSDLKSSSVRRLYEPLPTGFAEFWSMAPRRVCKADAIKAWEKARLGGWLPPLEVITASLAWQTEEWDRLDTAEDKRPHPATWINGKRWENEKPAQRQPARSRRETEQMESLTRIAMKGPLR